MATYTSNYNLKKPAETDFYDIEDFNGNTDIIDEALNNKLETDFSNVSGGAVPIANGGTGATTAYGACTNLGALPLTGGTMSGQVEIAYNSVAEASFTVTNPNGSVQLSVNNSRVLYDKANSKWVVQSSPGSTDWNFNGTAQNADTLDGYHANSFSKTGQLHQAGQGLYNGYSFQNDGANNTGMFS